MTRASVIQQAASARSASGPHANLKPGPSWHDDKLVPVEGDQRESVSPSNDRFLGIAVSFASISASELKATDSSSSSHSVTALIGWVTGAQRA